MTNKELIQKADLAISDLSTNGGYLSPEQSDAFIRTLIAAPTILKQCRQVTMSAPKREINKIGFGSRIMKPATAATALVAGDRVKPDLGKVTLSTIETMAEVWLSYDVIEDNIEKENLSDSIMDMIAGRVALDLEELALKGDTASGDTYLALLNGWLKLTTTNVYNAASAAISKDVFKGVVKAMPDQYLQRVSDLRHYCAVDQETEYRSQLADRQTAGGDSYISGRAPVYAFGAPIEMCPNMPSANMLFTFPQNLIFGIQRQIQIETDKDIRARNWIIVVTCRVDFKIEEEKAVVKTTTLA